LTIAARKALKIIRTQRDRAVGRRPFVGLILIIAWSPSFHKPVKNKSAEPLGQAPLPLGEGRVAVATAFRKEQLPCRLSYQ